MVGLRSRVLAVGIVAAALAAASVSAVRASAVPRATGSQHLTQVAFSTPSDGIGVVTRVSGAACVDLVGVTRDAGRRYGSLVPVASWSCNAAFGPADLTLDGRGDAFLYGPDLHVSHDGGRTWSRDDQPGAVLSVSAIGASVWMVESGCPRSTRATVCPLRVLTSADGGRTWSRSIAPGAALGPRVPNAPAQGQTYLMRTSASAAFLVSIPRAASGHETLWHTTDAGASWAPHVVTCRFPKGWNALSVALAVAPGGVLDAVCAGGPTAGSQPKTAIRSTDGGATWGLMFACPLTSARCPSAALNNGYLGGIASPTADTIFLAGDRSSLLVSRDDGQRWSPVRPLVGSNATAIAPPTFFNPRDGVLLEPYAFYGPPSTLWSTSDGGLRWTPRVPAVR